MIHLIAQKATPFGTDDQVILGMFGCSVIDEVSGAIIEIAGTARNLIDILEVGRYGARSGRNVIFTHDQMRKSER